MDDAKKLEIATFRYGIIAPVLHGQGTGQMEYFRKMASRPLDVPHVGPKRYAPGTFKSWLRLYRRDGLDGLIPKRRVDAGAVRVITPEMNRRISEILADHPRMSVTYLRELLIDEGIVTSKSPSETTLRRHIRTEGLRPPSADPPTARKRFEKPRANDLWTLDFMHGPRVRGPRRSKIKTYLAAAIDDHSRYLPLGVFLAAETYSALASALKVAFLRHGLPKTLYCDNGSAFSSADLALACARLGVALVHSKPYDSPSRGKIERFFGTVRSRFLAVVNLGESTSLEYLNTLFDEWLEHDYHRRIHSGIKERPLDRYMRSLASSRPRKVSREEIDLVFYRTLKRKVRGDCTVSIARRLFEVPADWIGKTVEIRYPLDEPDKLYIFSAGNPVCRLRPVNLVDNARTTKPIRFSLFDDEEQS